MPLHHPGRGVVLASALLAGLVAATAGAQTRQDLTYPGAAGRPVGKADTKFSQPSLLPGVDYTLPTPAEIKAVLDRVREHYERSTRRISRPRRVTARC